MSISKIASASGFSPDWLVKFASYTGDSVDVGLAASPRDMFFKPDGMSVYIASLTNGIYQYDLTSPWDITTATYSQVFSTGETQNLGIYIKPDGLRMYVKIGGSVYEYNLSVAWDISTAIYSRNELFEDNFPGLWFSNDGNSVFVSTRSGVFISTFKISEYPLSSTWNITSAGGRIAEYFGGLDNYGTFYFSDDKTQGAAIGALGVEVEGDVASQFDATSQDSAFAGVFFQTPRIFFLLGANTGLIYKYTIA